VIRPICPPGRRRLGLALADALFGPDREDGRPDSNAVAQIADSLTELRRYEGTVDWRA
jgi:hypothetical protein